MRQHENWQKRKFKVYRYKFQGQIYIIYYNYLSKYFFFGLSAISKLFLLFLKLLLIEHVFVCWKRYSTKTIVVLILKYLAQQTNTYSKPAAETLKQEVKSVKS